MNQEKIQEARELIEKSEVMNYVSNEELDIAFHYIYFNKNETQENDQEKTTSTIIYEILDYLLNKMRSKYTN